MRMRRRSGAAGCSAACSAEVGTVVSEQLRAYLTAAALGAAAGAIYDLLRLVRLGRLEVDFAEMRFCCWSLRPCCGTPCG